MGRGFGPRKMSSAPAWLWGGAGDVFGICFFPFGLSIVRKGNTEDGAAETGRHGYGPTKRARALREIQKYRVRT